jgi:hypothetical protein
MCRFRMTGVMMTMLMMWFRRFRTHMMMVMTMMVMNMMVMMMSGSRCIIYVTIRIIYIAQIVNNIIIWIDLC